MTEATPERKRVRAIKDHVTVNLWGKQMVRPVANLVQDMINLLREHPDRSIRELEVKLGLYDRQFTCIVLRNKTARDIYQAQADLYPVRIASSRKVGRKRKPVIVPAFDDALPLRREEPPKVFKKPPIPLEKLACHLVRYKSQNVGLWASIAPLSDIEIIERRRALSKTPGYNFHYLTILPIDSHVAVNLKLPRLDQQTDLPV